MFRGMDVDDSDYEVLLRDLFAGLAMQAMIEETTTVFEHTGAITVASLSYTMADMMLVEREKRRRLRPSTR